MAKTNGMTAEKIAEAGSFLSRVENIRTETASATDEHMAFCKEQKSAENEVLQEAKAAGFKPKALKALLKKRDLARKMDKVGDALEVDDQNELELLEEKLGGLVTLPLGQAAVAAAKEKKKPVGDAANTAAKH